MLLMPPNAGTERHGAAVSAPVTCSAHQLGGRPRAGAEGRTGRRGVRPSRAPPYRPDDETTQVLPRTLHLHGAARAAGSVRHRPGSELGRVRGLRRLDARHERGHGVGESGRNYVLGPDPPRTASGRRRTETGPAADPLPGPLPPGHGTPPRPAATISGTARCPQGPAAERRQGRLPTMTARYRTRTGRTARGYASITHLLPPNVGTQRRPRAKRAGVRWSEMLGHELRANALREADRLDSEE